MTDPEHAPHLGTQPGPAQTEPTESQAHPATPPVATGQPNGAAQSEPVNFNQYGEGGIQAFNVHLNGDQVLPVPITGTDPALAASEDGRFIPPRNAPQWAHATKRLDECGIVVLCAPPGSGRRTAAVKLLRAAGDARLTLFDLEPEWSKPSTNPLPKGWHAGYILDLSDIPEPPADRFGEDLATLGAQLRERDSFLVVLATPADWYGHWAEPTLAFTIPLESPDARRLVESELKALQRMERLAWLNRAEFTAIWSANPSAREARRLARLVNSAPDEDAVSALVDEFGDWHTTVEDLLSKDPKKDSDPTLLSTRVTVWAGALLHGGQRSSVIKAADDLLTRLNVSRDAAHVLTDATTSRRLEAAQISRDGDRAYHDKTKQGLPEALLRHLWDEFPTQHELLRKWATDVAADRGIPEEDARLVTRALLRLAVHRHDRAILDGLANGLAGTRRTLAVETLTTAAGDAELGRYVRDRLRQWVDTTKPSTDRVDLVVEICAGRWGVEQPALALTRLGKAAGHKAFGTPALIHAFEELARQRPNEVRKAVDQWLSHTGLESEDRLRRQTLGAFLALVSSDVGTDLILDDAQKPEARQRFVWAWQALLATDDATNATEAHLARWRERFEEDADRREAVLDLLADIFTPPRLRSGLGRLMVAETSTLHPFWQQVLEQAAHRDLASREASAQ
ncbi:hypothetical protein Stsp02_63500 [Streptomyces sp. NBRC 14336]|uniref:hypothetical protein n=1 Tax=Streptomyces sp. NBRC 14336 TaxID=3030992 RepID=UPI0024A5202D|nr:hypothetical protein [Streptomyces sp. NBRC 14336]GLW50689.1 hypothetical protein Stsp02_63500 [Streptomyces sp. NBRC 14336]